MNFFSQKTGVSQSAGDPKQVHLLVPDGFQSRPGEASEEEESNRFVRFLFSFYCMYVNKYRGTSKRRWHNYESQSQFVSQRVRVSERQGVRETGSHGVFRATLEIP